MYSNEDFENFYVRYKIEGLPKGITIQSWCIRNNVSWNLFNKWYRDTRHRIVPVEVSGKPEDEHDSEETEADKVESTGTPASKSHMADQPQHPVRIMIDIRMTNGMRIQQKNLSYGKLRKLVEKLEGLC